MVYWNQETTARNCGMPWNFVSLSYFFVSDCFVYVFFIELLFVFLMGFLTWRFICILKTNTFTGGFVFRNVGN